VFEKLPLPRNYNNIFVFQKTARATNMSLLLSADTSSAFSSFARALRRQTPCTCGCQSLAESWPNVVLEIMFLFWCVTQVTQGKVGGKVPPNLLCLAWAAADAEKYENV